MDEFHAEATPQMHISYALLRSRKQQSHYLVADYGVPSAFDYKAGW